MGAGAAKSKVGKPHSGDDGHGWSFTDHRLPLLSSLMPTCRVQTQHRAPLRTKCNYIVQLEISKAQTKYGNYVGLTLPNLWMIAKLLGTM